MAGFAIFTWWAFFREQFSSRFLSCYHRPNHVTGIFSMVGDRADGFSKSDHMKNGGHVELKEWKPGQYERQTYCVTERCYLDDVVGSGWGDINI